MIMPSGFGINGVEHSRFCYQSLIVIVECNFGHQVKVETLTGKCGTTVIL
jgi:hypothetical protein